MIARIAATLVFLMLAATSAPAQPQDVKGTDFHAYIRNLWPQAQARGISAETFDSAFLGLQPDPSLAAITRRQAEYGRPAAAYLADMASPARIAAAQRQMARWADTLAAIERRFGVDPAIVIAIWGMETGFGGNTGGKDIIRSLTTLAASGYREAFCRDELLHALKILQDGHITRERMTGSWAGAMGQPQFIPSSFVRYAVDFSGDGRRDIWSNIPDVLASIANYLKEHGWQKGQRWGYEIATPAQFDFRKSRGSFAEWKALGFRRADGGALPASGDAYLLYPSGAQGPGFLVTGNFATIKRYNISDIYALAAAHLADRIRGGRPFVQAWPARDHQLSRSERITIQRALHTRGYAVNNFVGQIDFVQRDAIRTEQEKAGLRMDGHPSLALLQWLSPRR